MWEWLSLLVTLWLALFRGRRALLLENLLLRQQLAAALRTRRRPDVRWHDQLFWVVARRLCADWRRHLMLVQPETVLRWHRQGWRLFWWWRSRRPTGRPRLPQEVRDLIRRLSAENRLWGTERIRGELLKLGITASNGSIRRYRWRPAPRPPSQSWGTFLRTHAHALWAADLFTVQTITFKTLYVLFFITHGRRELVHAAVTAHPTAAWVWRQLVEATPWGRQPKYLIRDRDRVYGGEVDHDARRPAARPQGRAGGDQADLRLPKTIESLQFLHDLLWKHQVSPQRADQRGGVGTEEAFLRGNVSMYFQATENAGTIRNRAGETGLDWDFVPLPRGAGGTGSRVGMDGYMLSKQATEAGWVVLRELNSVEGAQLRGELHRWQPSRRSALDAWAKGYGTKNAKLARTLSDQAVADPRAFWKEGDKVGEILGRWMGASLSRNEVGVAEAMRQAMTEIRGVLGA